MFLCPTLSDFIGFKTVYFVNMVLQLIFVATIWFVRHKLILYGLCVSGIFFTLGSTACFPPLCSRVFGLGNGSLMWTFIHFVIPVSSSVNFFLKQFAREQIDPLIFNMVGAGASFLNMVLILCVAERPLKRKNGGRFPQKYRQ